MDQRPTLITASGAPVSDNQHSQTAGINGPVLLQDAYLIEKLARFNRERIPERVVHAVGVGAHGYFEVTNPDVPKWTKMKMMSAVGKRTELFVRFSTVAGSRGAADTQRDPRGFAVKFYTEDGNWDLVGNNTPTFFIRDGIKFPDFIHSQKPDPYSNRQEAENVFDFFSHSPEATHQFTWLFGDRGIPASLRKMDGFGSHTFQWVNHKGEVFWVKFHFKTDQGIECLTSEEAARIGGENPTYLQDELYAALERGEYPSWTLKVQIMPAAEAPNYRFNPFDLTKVWSQKDYPLIEVGRMVLTRAPDNHFAFTEQAAFSPANFVPGVGPSPDRMLQARLFAYGDAHRYRLGINHTMLPVNAPNGVRAGVGSYGRDGFMCFGDNGGRSPNYEPNSFNGPVQTNEEMYAGVPVLGFTGAFEPGRHKDDNDFVQAGDLYRLMSEAEKERLVNNLANGLAQVKRGDVVERVIGYLTNADADYGRRVAEAVERRRSERAG